MCSVAEKASSQMPPTAKSTMYSATSAGEGISRVIPAFTAKCQNASSSSGTISASTVPRTRCQRLTGTRAARLVAAAAVARHGGSCPRRRAGGLSRRRGASRGRDFVREARVEEVREVRQLADLAHLQHLLRIGARLRQHGVVQLPDVLDVARRRRPGPPRRAARRGCARSPPPPPAGWPSCIRWRGDGCRAWCAPAPGPARPAPRWSRRIMFSPPIAVP